MARLAVRSVLAAALALTLAHPAAALPAGDPWTDLGQSLAGGSGAPLLTGSGSLAGGTTATLLLTNAKPSAPALLVVGLSPLNAPFKGGVMVPALTLTLNLITGAGGSIQSSSTMPNLP